MYKNNTNFSINKNILKIMMNIFKVTIKYFNHNVKEAQYKIIIICSMFNIQDLY